MTFNILLLIICIISLTNITFGPILLCLIIYYLEVNKSIFWKIKLDQRLGFARAFGDSVTGRSDRKMMVGLENWVVKRKKKSDRIENFYNFL